MEEQEIKMSRRRKNLTPSEIKTIEHFVFNDIYKNVSTRDLFQMFNEKYPNISIGYSTMCRIRNGFPVSADPTKKVHTTIIKEVVSIADVIEITNRFVNSSLPTLLEEIEDKMGELLDTIEEYTKRMCIDGFDPIGKIKSSKIPKFLGELRTMIDAYENEQSKNYNIEGEKNDDSDGSV